MANEWTKIELYGANNDGEVRRYTIADGTSVSKGQLLQLTDPRTVTAKGNAVAPCAGVASEDHKAGLGVTTIGAWTNGIFSVQASDAIAVGEALTGVADNEVHTITVASGAAILGYALEAIADGTTGTVRLRL